jgi:hypothetical protein
MKFGFLDERRAMERGASESATGAPDTAGQAPCSGAHAAGRTGTKGQPTERLAFGLGGARTGRAWD